MQEASALQIHGLPKTHGPTVYPTKNFFLTLTFSDYATLALLLLLFSFSYVLFKWYYCVFCSTSSVVWYLWPFCRHKNYLHNLFTAHIFLDQWWYFSFCTCCALIPFLQWTFGHVSNLISTPLCIFSSPSRLQETMYFHKQWPSMDTFSGLHLWMPAKSFRWFHLTGTIQCSDNG